MGKCVSTPKSTKQPLLRKVLMQAILSGKVQQTKRFLTLLVERFGYKIDDPITMHEGILLNPLALAFESGSAGVAEWLIGQGADITKLHETYQGTDRSVVDRICERGFLDLLKYFLPIHLKFPTIRTDEISLESIEDLSIFLDQQSTRQKIVSEMHKQRYLYIPAIQRACKQGHMKLIEWVWEYFQDKFIPPDFDVESIDEYLGENSALVAVRNAQLEVMKFLHEQCSANFRRLNRRSEGAIQIAIIGSLRWKSRKYLPCLKYLIELVGVDPTYHYDETLLLCEDSKLVEYLEEQLLRRGVRTTKAAMERENQTATRWRQSSEEGEAEFPDEVSISVIPLKAQIDASQISMF